MFKLIATLATALFCVVAQAETRTVDIGDFQRTFIETIHDFASKYQNAGNDLQKSALVTERFERFKKLKGDPRKIAGWIGILEAMGTNGDGKAFVTIRLSKRLTVSTWNNALSDSGDRTLIPQSSPVFKKLAQMKEGNVVKFSGSLKRSKNLTEEGRMVSPDFLFAFSDIEKLGDSVK